MRSAGYAVSAEPQDEDCRAQSQTALVVSATGALLVRTAGPPTARAAATAARITSGYDNCLGFVPSGPVVTTHRVVHHEHERRRALRA